MSATDPRTELASLAASLRAYLEVQADTGAIGIPRGVKAAGAAPTHVAPTPSAAAPRERERDAVTREPSPAAPSPMPAAPSPMTGEGEHSSPASPPPSPGGGAAGVEGSHATAASRDIPSTSPSTPAPTLARLPLLAAEVSSCTKCVLHETRKQTVFARGNPQARIAIVGEAPGADEDEQGLPFVGRAGQLLDKMIGAMGLNPETDVYVCNILKCRPPGNRRPEPEETERCIPYLHEQLAIVKPKVIVAMGNSAVQALLGTKLGITKVRGQWKLYKGETLVMPTYHPSYLLRPSPQQVEAKKQAWEDLQAVMKELGLALPAKK